MTSDTQTVARRLREQRQQGNYFVKVYYSVSLRGKGGADDMEKEVEK